MHAMFQHVLRKLESEHSVEATSLVCHVGVPSPSFQIFFCEFSIYGQQVITDFFDKLQAPSELSQTPSEPSDCTGILRS